MIKVAQSFVSHISLSKLLRSSKPKEELAMEIVTILAPVLKNLKIIWSPEAFKGGLLNADLPKGLLTKLEKFIETGSTTGWRLASAATEELDELVEDIESFNPPFIAAISPPKNKRTSL